MIWFFLAIAFCTVRASHTFVIIIAFLSIFFRLIQAVSQLIPKGYGKFVGFVMYAILVIFLFLMFGASFIGLRPGYDTSVEDAAAEAADAADSSSAA